MNPVRSVAAIFGGILLLAVLDRMLPSLITHVIASFLAGFLIARIAGTQELRHAAAAAAILTAGYLVMVLSDNPDLPPTSTRIAVLVVTGPAILAGAWIRASARAILNDSHVTKEQQ